MLMVKYQYGWLPGRIRIDMYPKIELRKFIILFVVCGGILGNFALSRFRIDIVRLFSRYNATRLILNSQSSNRFSATPSQNLPLKSIGIIWNLVNYNILNSF
eukprot:TRINITY_DN5522_c0_g1_i1.p3 TRINITY_DN5522_c0_g1~~TRINITY_DN5522_c0_g1_i1.p3  ORF type:complete len:102 (-),score=1.00 TRINITY_DN5522_c0_g1_i1:234-539(-)